MVHFLIILLITIVLSSLAYQFFLKKENMKNMQKIRYISMVSLFSLFTSVLIVRLALGKSLFLVQTTKGSILYDGVLVAVSIILIAFVTLMKIKLPQKEVTTTSALNRVLVGILKVVASALFCLGLFFWLWSNWFVQFFGELTPEQFLFNLNSPIKGTSSDVTNNMSHTPLLLVLCGTILFLIILMIRIPQTKEGVIKKWGMIRTTVLSLVSVAMFLFGINFSINTLHLMEVYRAYTESSGYIKDNYVNPSQVQLKFPEQKRNLIHIYAESVESSYFSKELGGYMNENLMPQMYEFSKHGVHFSQSDKMGGSYQTYGSSWSVAGMVNMECGVPLKIPMDGNSYGKGGQFLPGITNLGDVLHKQGYNQTILFGADAEFGGLDAYFTQHGKFKIFDVKEARSSGLIPTDYSVWWGFEDDKLFDYAKAEATRLYNEGKPFHLNMETADTHFPDGYVSKNLRRTRASQYADVIAYSDEQIAEFVKWIQKQPFYENTTIVITGDHLSMDKTFFKDFDAQYHRAPFNLFLNAKTNGQNIRAKNRTFAPLDMFPTIVSSMGVEIPGNRLGLGTDLFSGERTLIEKDGLEKFNQELGNRSDFYDTHFISIASRRDN
ncbi:MAG: LTA synthase family protein [Culicoidibacterales bacterium]